MENISIQYPSWFIILCGVLGLVYAFFVYYKNKRTAALPKWLQYLLAAIRFLTVGMLSFFLLSPLVRTTDNEIKSPKLIVLNDVSESIKLGTEEDQTKTLQSVIADLEQNLGENNEIIQINFGESVRKNLDSLSYTDKATNISDALSYAQEVYGHENIGALILASDGIYNQGQNPIYQSLQLKAPLHTIGMGDTTKRRDLSIKKVFNNKIAYLDDKFEVQVDLQAYQANGSTSSVVIYKVIDGKPNKLDSKRVRIKNNDFFTTEDFLIDAKTPGVNQYRIAFNPLENENITSNNYKDIFVEVLDSKQKVLILANAPHPDLAALKNILETNKNNVVDIKYGKDISNLKGKYDLAVYHNLPSKKYSLDAVQKTGPLRSASAVYIVGNQTSLNAFNALQNILEIKGSSTSQNEVQATLNSSFGLFKMESDLKNSLSKYPPLIAPFGEFKEGPNTEVLAYQQIKKIDTKYPLISLGEEKGKKIAIISGDGLWKWRLFDHLQNKNHNLINALINKVFGYTAIKEDKRKFRVTSSKRLYNESERIIFDAELYNEAYERINEPEIALQIKNSEGKVYEFSFSREDDYYSLDAGLFTAGTYNYTTTVNYRGSTLSQKGKFTVKEIQLESYKLTADHNLLYKLSEKYNGKFYDINSANTLTTDLQTSAVLKPVIFENNTTRSLIYLKWIFGLLLFLLILEWFLRRYFGTY